MRKRISEENVLYIIEAIVVIFVFLAQEGGFIA